jgi:hypothetical protein
MDGAVRDTVLVAQVQATEDSLHYGPKQVRGQGGVALWNGEGEEENHTNRLAFFVVTVRTKVGGVGQGFGRIAVGGKGTRGSEWGPELNATFSGLFRVALH